MGYAKFSAFGAVAVEETQPQPIADFADFSEVLEPNPIDSSSPQSNSISNSPCTITARARTKEPVEDEMEMASAARTVPFDAKKVVADPSEQTGECFGIKSKTI